MEKAIIYIRVSSDKQTEESQKKPCFEFCKKMDWEVIGVYADHAKSAYKNVRRPSYEKVISSVKKKEAKHIVVWAIDRWCRKGAKELQETLIYLDAYGFQLHSVQESWLDAINVPGVGHLVKDFLIGIVAWMAKTESDLKSERVKTSKKFQKAIKKGKVGRPSVINLLYDSVVKLLNAGKSYSYIHDNVTYKAKYGKIKHISAPTISEIKKSALENGDIKIKE